MQAVGRSLKTAVQLETHAKLAGCWTGPDFDTEQTPWAVAFILAPANKIGSFPWWDRGQRDMEKSGAEPL